MNNFRSKLEEWNLMYCAIDFTDLYKMYKNSLVGAKDLNRISREKMKLSIFCTRPYTSEVNSMKVFHL